MSSESTSSQTVGTLNELSTVRADARSFSAVVDSGIAHHRRTDAISLCASQIGDESVVDPVDVTQRLLDFGRIDGRAADLEHVVGPTVVEQEPLVVEAAEITGGVKAVGGEQVLSAAPAYPAQRVWSPNLDHPNGSRRDGLSTRRDR